MAVVARPPAGPGAVGQQLQQRKRVLSYGEDTMGECESGGEMRSRSRSRSRSGRRITGPSGGGNVVGRGLPGGWWCGGCMTSWAGAVSPPSSGGGLDQRGRKGKVGGEREVGVVVKSSLMSGGGSPALRPRMSPGKVSPLVEVAPPPTSTGVALVQREGGSGGAGGGGGVAPPAVFSMASYVAVAMAGRKSHVVEMSSSPPVDKIKASPTLFEMMSHEQQLQGVKPVHSLSLSQQLSFQEKMKSVLLAGTSPGNQFNDSSTSDLKLTLNNREGYNVTVNVHRHILVTHSRFFATKLSDHRWSTQQQQRSTLNLVEITDIDDVEIYLETLRLMYCEDVKRSLMKENVSRVLAILKLSAHIMFEAGVFACLEYLEAAPWADDEEEKVTALMGQLQLDQTVGVAADVMKRCATVESSNSEEVLVRLLHSVTEGTDDKARREMKSLVSRMLRENMSQNKHTVDVSKESLYRACHGCLDSLLHLFMQSKGGEDRGMLVEISRQADNLHWLVDILIDRRIADDFVRMWAHQAELAMLHAQVPVMFRYEVSRLTARLCIAIGKGQILSPKDVRFLLLSTWLQPLVDDFAWMQRCCRNLDKKVVEEGISQTILTLPLKQQQSILLSWFDRFSTSGDDCPNLQKAFEVWWRRTFTRPCSIVEDDSVDLQSSF